MSLKKRDAVAIGGVGNYMQEASAYLLEVKKKTISDIENMLVNYQGIDADIIKTKLIDALNKLDSLIIRFDYYSKYFQNISSHDRENIKNSSSRFKKMLSNLSTNANIYTNTINNDLLEDNIIKMDGEKNA